MIKTMIKDANMRAMLSILRIYIILIVVENFYQKELKLRSVQKVCVICVIKKSICTHQNFKANIKPWINTEKNHRQ